MPSVYPLAALKEHLGQRVIPEQTLNRAWLFPFLPRFLVTAVIAVFGLFLMRHHDEIWTVYITQAINYRTPTFEDLFFRLPLAAFVICLCARGKSLFRAIPAGPPSWLYSIFSWCIFASGIWYLNALCIKLKDNSILPETFLLSGTACLLVCSISAVAANFLITIPLLHTWFKEFKRPFMTAFGITIILKAAFLNAFNPFPQDNWITNAAYPLKWVIFSSIHGIIRLFFDNPVLDLETLAIGTEQFFVRLHFGCSGYQGLSLFLVCALCFYNIFRNELKLSGNKFAVTLLTGAAVVFTGNILRIAGLIAIGDTGLEAWALGGFHSSAGAVLFFIIFGGYAYLIHRLFARAPKPAKPILSEIINNNPAAPYIVPFMGLACATIFLRIFSIQWDWLYPVRILICAWLLWYFRNALSFKERVPLFDYLAAFSAGVGIAIIWIAVPAGHHFHPEGGFLAAYPLFFQYAWIFFRFAGSVLVIPIVEELLFRGYLPRVLIHLDFEKIPIGTFSPFSFLASAAAFGLLHQHLIGGIISGIIFNLVLMRTRSFKAVVICHSAANLIIFLDALSRGIWSS